MGLMFMCVKIFFARILDVTISTFRQNIMLKGQSFLATILAFFEIMIWFMVAREALVVSIDSILIPISYSLGYATGTLIGSTLSKKLIKGVIGVQIITDEDKMELVNALKLRGYGMSLLHLESGYNMEPKLMIFIEVNNKSLKKLENLVHKIDADAFIVISDTKRVYNGTVK